MNPSPFNLNLALVIDVNNYQNGIPSLGTARPDAEAIAISKLLIQKCDSVAAPTEHRTER